MKTMTLDFVRQVIEQTFKEEHDKNQQYFGGQDQVNLMSFYEQLVEDYEVDRFTEIYQDLVDQQNRTGLIMNGTIVAQENPQIMNVHVHDIRPLTFTCSFRVALKDRDQAIETIENMFSILKGRKRDVACFDNGKLFMVGTIANNVLGTPTCKSGDYLGSISTSDNITTQVNALLTNLYANTAIIGEKVNGTYYYVETLAHKLFKVVYNATSDKWELEDIDIAHSTFKKYKVSLSFDSTRIDEPKTLNADEYCTIMFGGSATIVSGEVELGNDLTKVGVLKWQIKAQSNIELTDTTHWLEPLEMTNNLGIAEELSQLTSSNFVQSKQNTGINPTLSYSFVLDKSEPLIYQWWKYARYGIQGKADDTPAYSSGVTPNTIYALYEYWSSWGNAYMFASYVKATTTLEGDNTESDVLTLKLTFEVQGDI